MLIFLYKEVAMIEDKGDYGLPIFSMYFRGEGRGCN